jgi:hypothetical protein
MGCSADLLFRPPSPLAIPSILDHLWDAIPPQNFSPGLAIVCTVPQSVTLLASGAAQVRKSQGVLVCSESPARKDAEGNYRLQTDPSRSDQNVSKTGITAAKFWAQGHRYGKMTALARSDTMRGVILNPVYDVLLFNADILLRSLRLA